MYQYLDRVIKGTVIEIYNEFSDFRLQMQFDELNVFTATKELYNRLTRINNRTFKRIANFYYKSTLNTPPFPRPFIFYPLP